MTETTRVSIAKLNNENYQIWKYKVELLLIKDDLWETVRDNPVVPVTAGWQKRDDKARATICLLIEDNQLVHVRSASSARAAWDALKAYHEKSSLSSKVFLLKNVVNLKLQEDGSMEEHISKILDLVDKLTALGERIVDSLLIAIILGSLPDSYSTLVTALESRSEEELTLTLVKGKLIDEYKRRRSVQAEQTGETAMKAKYVRDRNAIECYFCKNKGHLKKDCMKYKRWKAKQEKAGKASENKPEKVEKENEDSSKEEEDSVQVCFMVHHRSTEPKGWYIDSGATSHMFGDRQFFTTLSQTDQRVRLADGKEARVEGMGTGELKCIGGNGKKVNITLTNVLYVPTLEEGLISVRKLVEKGLQVKFSESGCIILKNNLVIAQGIPSSGLYKLNLANAAIQVQSAHTKDCQHTWHRKFGHRHHEAVKQLSQGLATGIKIRDCGIRTTCECCIKGKMSRLPFPKKSETRSKAVLDLLHSGLCGPIQVNTPSGKRFILTIIDDYSRFTHVYLLDKKSGTTGAIRKYLKMVETEFGRRPKVLRSDRGREYIDKDLVKEFEEKGTQIQLTAPYSPQQNGVAERKNRALMEMVRCLLLDANMPGKYWGEAVSMANYLQNRLPTKGASRTPYELWKKEVPDMKDLHIFGCTAYAHIPKVKRQKLDAKALELTFVGYEPGSKAYRLLNQRTGKITISRDVIFFDVETNERQLGTVEIKLEAKKEQVQEIIILEEHCIEEKENRSEENVLEEASESNEEETVYSQVSEEHLSGEDLEGRSESRGNEESDENEPRRSNRSNKGVLPKRYPDHALQATSEFIEPKTYKEATTGTDTENWKQAMKEELESLHQHQTWELVELPEDRKIVGSKWVYKIKCNEEGKICRYKARLVAQGYTQKYGIDYDEVFAPVARQTTIRVLLTIAGKRKLKVRQFDVKTAFLNGDLHETIDMKQPQGFEVVGKENKVCRLKKSVYGLKQAAKAWNDKLKEVLKFHGFHQGEADPCLFVKNENGDCTYFVIYVDDMLLASNSENQINMVEKALRESFNITALGQINQYLGFRIRRDEEGYFYLDQKKYIQKIQRNSKLEDSKPSSFPMDPGYLRLERGEPLENNEQYQKLIGELLYLAVNSRPDILAVVCILAQHTISPTQQDWIEAKRIVRYLRGTMDLQLKLGPLKLEPFETKNSSKLLGYADADWAQNKSDRKSNSGYIFQLNGGAISWSCKRQDCIALSTTEAETIALSEACKEMEWIKRLLTDIQEEQEGPIVIHEDNQSCINSIQNGKFSNRTKHIDTKYYYARDLYLKKKVVFEYCPTEDMLADMLTKPLTAIKLKKLRELSGLRNWTGVFQKA